MPATMCCYFRLQKGIMMLVLILELVSHLLYIKLLIVVNLFAKLFRVPQNRR